MLTPEPPKTNTPIPATPDSTQAALYGGQPGGRRRPEEGYVDLHDLLEVLGRRWPIMLGVVLLTLVVGWLCSMNRQRLYTATAEIIISQSAGQAASRYGVKLPGVSKIEELATNRSIITQIRLLKSRALLTEALASLPASVQQEAAIHPPWVQVQPSADDGNILGVTVTALSPRLAASAANGLVDTFIQYDLAENRRTVTTALAYVEKELARVGAELHAARERLAEYEVQHGVSGDGGTLKQYNAQIGGMKAAIDDSINEGAIARETMKTLAARLDGESREVVQDTTEEPNPMLDRLDMQLMELEGQRLRLLEEYAPDAPEVEKVGGQIRAVRQQRTEYLATRVASKTHGLNPVYQQLQQQYLQASTTADTSQIRAVVLQRALADKRTAMADLPALTMQAAELQNTVSQLEATNVLLSDNYQSLRISEAERIADVRVLTRAMENPVPTSPSRTRNMAIALVLGVMIAIGLVMVLEVFDDRVHSEAALQRASALPVLAHIPFVRQGLPPLVTAETYQQGPILEGVRYLRSRLYRIAREMPLKVMAITSAESAEGKSSVAINLAIALAMDNKRVVLVDADLRRPSLHKHFGLDNTVGLTGVLAGEYALEKAICSTPVARVHVLPAGPLAANPAEALNTPEAHALLATLTEAYDLVILDAPPVAGISDTLVLAAVVDGLLVVASSGQTRRSLLQFCLGSLEQVGAPLLGVVLNRVPPSRHPYHYYSTEYAALEESPRRE